MGKRTSPECGQGESVQDVAPIAGAGRLGKGKRRFSGHQAVNGLQHGFMFGEVSGAEALKDLVPVWVALGTPRFFQAIKRVIQMLELWTDLDNKFLTTNPYLAFIKRVIAAQQFRRLIARQLGAAEKFVFSQPAPNFIFGDLPKRKKHKERAINGPPLVATQRQLDLI